jgi:hypothetical protein
VPALASDDRSSPPSSHSLLLLLLLLLPPPPPPSPLMALHECLLSAAPPLKWREQPAQRAQEEAIGL